MPRYIVQSSCAKMPRSCWGAYRHVAILLVDDTHVGDRVSMISERARGVIRIVSVTRRLSDGGTNSAYARKLAEYLDKAERLNADLAGTKEP